MNPQPSAPIKENEIYSKSIGDQPGAVVGDYREIIMDGCRVWDALTDTERRRTNATNVSDVLDAVQRVYKSTLTNTDKGSGHGR